MPVDAVGGVAAVGKFDDGDTEESDDALAGSAVGDKEQGVGVAKEPGVGAAHIAVAVFAALVVAAAAALALQYAHRYRKYQLASSGSSGEEPGPGSLLPSRASSATTLLSDVISLRRFGRRRIGPDGHRRLRDDRIYSPEHEYECIEERQLLRSTAVGCGDDGGNDGEGDCEGGGGAERSGRSGDGDPGALSAPSSPRARPRSATLTSTRRLTVVSAPSPALTTASAPSRPTTSTADSYTGGSSPEEVSTEAASSTATLEAEGDVGTMVEEGVMVRRPVSRGARTVSRGSSVATLANGRSSPALAALFIRGSNPKDHKDKRNRERLLAGSEFSLTGPDHDLELDYYDYNVSNAGAVPGSYLGMDPAYLVWIPPFAPGHWEGETDKMLLEEAVQPQEPSKDKQSQLNFQQVPEMVPRSLLASENLSAVNEDPKICQIIISDENDTKNKKEKKVSQRGNHYGTRNVSDSAIKSLEVEDETSLTTESSKPTEKETRVEKSPGDCNSFCDFLDVEDDIKFVDDEEDECNNIISESVISKSRKSTY